MRKTVLAFLSLASLCVCLMSAIFHFLGNVSEKSHRILFIVASIGWFVFAALWARKTKKA